MTTREIICRYLVKYDTTKEIISAVVSDYAQYPDTVADILLKMIRISNIINLVKGDYNNEN